MLVLGTKFCGFKSHQGYTFLWLIKSMIKKNKPNWEKYLNYKKNYSIISISDGIVKTKGVVPVGVGKLVYFVDPKSINNIVPGIIMSSERTYSIIFILGQNFSVTTEHLIVLFYNNRGTQSSKFVSKSDFTIEVKVSKLLGKTLDIFGNTFKNDKTHFLWVPKPLNGVSDRVNVWKPLFTGIKVIDSLFPIGLGQRQLIIGDRNTGKTTIAVDTILSQKRTALKCIYVSIGQKKSAVNRIRTTFEKNEAFYYTSMISADSSDPVALQFLAPYTGCSLGEIFSILGGETLIIYDDLSKHSVAYRQMALLLRKSPGRDAFPSDIFYLHSNLLERAGQFYTGSLTALPIVETLSRDVSAYIPTNIISITDGQIFLDSSYFNKGILPAVHTSLSVSRVGSKSQYPCMSHLTKWVKQIVNEYKELEALSSFASDLDKHTLEKLKLGIKLNEFLCQMKNQPVNIYDQIILFSLMRMGCLKKLVFLHIVSFVDFYTKWSAEFLSRCQGQLDSYSSFSQHWYFDFSDKEFMEKKNFKIFASYIISLFYKQLKNN